MNKNKISLAIACDHGGFLLKEALVKELQKKYLLFDLGTFSHQKCDYPNFASKVCHMVLQKKATIGIVCCTSGVGVNIACNRFQGIRALRCQNNDQELVTISKKHNDINVLTFGYAFITLANAIKMIEILLTTTFLNLPRYQKRIKLLDCHNSKR